MELDARTLVWVNVVVALAIAALTFAFWSTPPTVRGLRGWSVGVGVSGLGALALALGDTLPAPLLSIVPSTLIVAGFAIVWTSIRRFNDTSFKVSRVAGWVALCSAAFLVAWLLGADARHRTVIVTLLMGVLALLTCWEIARAYRADPLRGRWPAAAAFALLGATMIGRSTIVLQSMLAGGTAEAPDPTRAIGLFVTAICMVAITLGLLMMSNERLRNRYARLARTDDLTELPNRRAFIEQGARLAGRAAQSGLPVSLLIIDLDHFSRVNEQFGHAGGDHALEQFAALLRRTVRPNDLLCRYGGEEFCVLLVGTAASEGARVAERIRAALADAAFGQRGRVIRFTVSIGVAELDGDGLAAAIQRADEALYRAKAEGRNRVVVAAFGGDGLAAARPAEGRRPLPRSVRAG